MLHQSLKFHTPARLQNNPESNNDTLALNSTHISFDEQASNEKIIHWKNQLSNLTTLYLPTDFSNIDLSFSGKSISFSFNNNLINQIQKQFSSHTINEIILASIQVLLYKYNHETDILIGINIQASTQQSIDNAVCKNIIPLRLIFSPQTNFVELLTLTTNTFKKNAGYGVPSEYLPKDIYNGIQNSNEIFPYKVRLHINENQSIIFNERELKDYNKEDYFDIHINNNAMSVDGIIHFNKNLFKEGTIRSLILRWQKILTEVSKQPFYQIINIPILLENEKYLIGELNQFNLHQNLPFTQSQFPLVQDYFHQLCLEKNNQAAIIFHADNKTQISYKELDYITTQLAAYLDFQESNTEKNSVIGICLGRSLSLMTAIVAALKTTHPLVILENQITNTKLLENKLKNHVFSHIIIDNSTKELFDSKDDFSLINMDDQHLIDQINQQNQAYISKNTAKDIAYISYTSGSSGNPKGVMITNEGLANLLNTLINKKFDLKSRVLSLFLPTFDAFFYDWLIALATGGELHLTKENDRFNPSIISSIIEKNSINFGVFLPDLLSQLDPKLPLKYVTSMGAMAHDETMRKWHRENRVIFNGYGPTETTIAVSLHTYQPGDDISLIGTPFENMKIFILDSNSLATNLPICPIGVPGEIYISGPGVAYGYSNNDELSKSAFPYLIYCPHTCSFNRTNETTSSAIKFYATGDYACYQFNSKNQLEIQFIGRKDRQVKIHGVRVELNGIETLLRQHPNIQDIIVLYTNYQEDTHFDKSDATKVLTAYIVQKNKTIDTYQLLNSIHQFMQTHTLLSPAHYPNKVMLLDAVPLNKNGKIDYSALPLPSRDHVAASTPLQKNIQEIWGKILNLPATEIGIRTPFSELGGNSFQLTQLKNTIKNKWNYSIDVWPAITIERLAIKLSTQKNANLVKKVDYSQNPNLMYNTSHKSKLNKTSLLNNLTINETYKKPS